MCNCNCECANDRRYMVLRQDSTGDFWVHGYYEKHTTALEAARALVVNDLCETTYVACVKRPMDRFMSLVHRETVTIDDAMERIRA